MCGQSWVGSRSSIPSAVVQWKWITPSSLIFSPKSSLSLWRCSRLKSLRKSWDILKLKTPRSGSKIFTNLMWSYPGFSSQVRLIEHSRLHEIAKSFSTEITVPEKCPSDEHGFNVGKTFFSILKSKCFKRRVETLRDAFVAGAVLTKYNALQVAG